MHLTCAVQDRSLGDYAERLKRLGIDGRLILSTVLNQAGTEVRLLTVKAETEQTGLPRKTIDRSQRAQTATPASLSYAIRSEGGNIRLKFFGAMETPGGVVAHPLGQARVWQHAFMRGGRFPDRVSIARLNGQVYERKEGAGRAIRVVRSGVVLPNELTTGRTADVFRAGVAAVVATAAVTRLGAMVG